MTDFVEGPPCKKCGGTRRYAKSRQCVPCKAVWQSSDKDRKNAYNRAYYARIGHTAKRKYHRDYHLKTAYSLSPEDYAKMYREQSGRCAICEAPRDTLCVDHNHDTLKVRGLLCTKCNSGIGHLSDSVVLLSRAILYLNNYNKLEEENGSLDPL